MSIYFVNAQYIPLDKIKLDKQIGDFHYVYTTDKHTLDEQTKQSGMQGYLGMFSTSFLTDIYVYGYVDSDNHGIEVAIIKCFTLQKCIDGYDKIKTDFMNRAAHDLRTRLSCPYLS